MTDLGVSELHRPDISVLIPCYNEEENAEAICAAAVRELESTGVSFEVIFIDNASTDRTVAIIKGICASDPRVRLIVNTRNFGQMRSPVHGVYQTQGRAVIGLSADFQDPPELIPELIAKWRKGSDIVLGIRAGNKDGISLRMFRSLSYWLGRKFGDYPIIPNATGFGLFDAKVVDATRAIIEPEPFFRGMLVETGYTITTVPYSRPPRAAGTSKNNFFGLLDFALSALAGASKKLLRFPLYIGLICGILTVLMLMGGAFAYVAGKPIAGWLIASVVQFEFSLLFIFLGLLGDNIRIISERTRKTPLVIERERVNFLNVND